MRRVSSDSTLYGRSQNGSAIMEMVLHDLRVATRSLTKGPGFTFVALLCFALGIGATSTIFDVVDTLYLRPPAGVGHPETLVRPWLIFPPVQPWRPAQEPSPPFGDAYVTLRANTRALSGLAAYGAVGDVSIGGGVHTAAAAALLVSGNYFSVLDVRPALGRFFLPDEDVGPGSPPVVVVSHRFWQRHLHGDPSVIGARLAVNGYPFTIVGVAAPGFHGLDPKVTAVWIPGAQKSHVTLHSDLFDLKPGEPWSEMVGRLAPGASRARAQQELAGILQHAAGITLHPAQAPRVVVGSIFAARGPYPSRQAVIAWWLALAAALVLAIACANVANLLLARAATRRAEIAIRLSLGASRWRVMRQLLIESLLLAGLGAGAGIALAVWAAGLVPTMGLPPLHFFAHGRVLIFAVVAATVCGASFGLAPALSATRVELATAVNDGGDEVSPRSRLRAALIVAQVALATVLLTGAGLFVHSLRNLRRIEPGFDVSRLLWVSRDLTSAGYSGPAIMAIYGQAEQQVRRIPGAVDATVASTVPLSGIIGVQGYSVRDQLDRVPDRPTGSAYYAFVGAGYFATIGTPLLQGRDISKRDRNDSQPVVIVNEALARREWPDGSAIGRSICVTKKACFTIVGVAANARYVRLGEDVRPAFFIPVTQMSLAFPASVRARLVTTYLSHLTLLVRSARDSASVMPAVRRVVQQIAPSLPYMHVRSLGDMLRAQSQPRRLAATMSALFGGLALALAAIGLYGVVSYTVQRRTHEMGVRIALGAAPSQVMALVVRQSVLLLLAGLALGLAGGFVTARLVAHLLFGVSAMDPLSFAGTCTLLACAGLAAAYVPARRVMRADPVESLRAE